jgi:hypothetical protein
MRLAMGCDIHVKPYREENGTFSLVEMPKYDGIFPSRDYRIYAFLADVRNNDGIEPICEPRGYPIWVTEPVYGPLEYWGPFGQTWLTVDELLNFDYERKCAPTETYREYLGPRYFSELERMVELGITHIFREFTS